MNLLDVVMEPHQEELGNIIYVFWKSGVEWELYSHEDDFIKWFCEKNDLTEEEYYKIDPLITPNHLKNFVEETSERKMKFSVLA